MDIQICNGGCERPYVSVDADMFVVRIVGYGYDVRFRNFRFPSKMEPPFRPDDFPMWAECAIGFLDGLIKAAEDAKQAIQSERVQAFCRTNGR